MITLGSVGCKWTSSTETLVLYMVYDSPPFVVNQLIVVSLTKYTWLPVGSAGDTNMYATPVTFSQFGSYLLAGVSLWKFDNADKSTYFGRFVVPSYASIDTSINHTGSSQHKQQLSIWCLSDDKLNKAVRAKCCKKDKFQIMQFKNKMNRMRSMKICNKKQDESIETKVYARKEIRHIFGLSKQAGLRMPGVEKLTSDCVPA